VKTAPTDAEAERTALTGQAVDRLEQQLKSQESPPIDHDQISVQIAPAIELRETGKYEEAQKWLHDWLTSHPRDAEGWSLLSHVYLLDNKDDESQKALNVGQAIAPNLPSVLRNQARILLKQTKLSEALIAAQLAFEKSPNDPESWLVLAASLGANKRDGDALALVERAIHARPNYAEAFINRAMIRLRAKNTLGALADAEHALSIKPHLTQFLALIATLRYQHRNLTGAIEALKRAHELEPANLSYMVDLGELLRQNNQVDEAISILKTAVQQAPNNANAWTNYGAALQEGNRIEEAKVAYEKSLGINPISAEILSNLGILAKDAENWEAALKYFEKALTIKPAHVPILVNAAKALCALSRHTEAEAYARKALTIDSRSAEVRAAYVACIKKIQFYQVDEFIYRTTADALSEPWCSPKELISAACNLLKLNPTFTGYLKRSNHHCTDDPSALRELHELTTLEQFDTDPLLNSLLRSVQINDEDVERFLTCSRSLLLEQAIKTKDPDEKIIPGLNFYVSLAHQCFINEYVFSRTSGERQAASDLRDLLIAAVDADHRIPAIWLIAVACYYPLHSVARSEKLLKYGWPEAITSIINKQIKEPVAELGIRSSIPLLTPIEDDISLEVKNQYEENPYPRWTKLPQERQRTPVDVYLQRKFPLTEVRQIENHQQPDILIAGCGTGEHPIVTAQRIRGANLLAVDLSIASLSYAKRKTQEMGIESIRYAQADILKLGSLGQTFDVIEASGVLHHLAKPFEGWRVLLSLLRRNGVMNLGLYSELARRNIVKARNLISQKGYGATPNEIRECRQYLRQIDSVDNLGNAIRASDFYSISTCRDLLFHAHEQRMTLDAIAKFLGENNLTFLGFEIDPSIIRSYKLRFPGDRAATNLDQWQIYESENPDTFFEMYQFWIQKR
jgi:tetratricopeptide (TPR) repeat protein/2-polyprenyl-3-methyl-5-hydroxy-6-metoxy-1,4-benzoquinol methylase